MQIVGDNASCSQVLPQGYQLCSGLLHYKPRNTNLQQYPLVVSSISCASRERRGKRWLKRYCVLTVTNTEV